jgi:hypothetical protein
VNDAPVLASVGDPSFEEDESGSMSLAGLGSDVDGDALTYSISGGDQITASLSGSDISFSAPENYNGSEDFTVFVSDDEYTDSQPITVTVTPVNDAPVANGTSVETDEDQMVVVSLSGSDIDGDNLSFSLVGNATHGIVTLNGSLATYTPSVNYNGDDSFTFSVSDGSDSSSASVSIVVSAVNDAPEIVGLSDQEIDEDGVLTIHLEGSDVDGDLFTYLASVSENGSASVSDSTLTVTLALPFSETEARYVNRSPSTSLPSK